MQQVISELQKLQRRSRLMLVTQRVSMLLAWTLGVMLGLIAFDYVFRLPSALRMLLLLAGVAALLYGVWRYLRTAIVFRPSLTQLALRVERVLPAVSGRLASSVEFAVAGVDQANQMAARTVRETQARLSGESVWSVVDRRRTWRDLGVMLLMVAASAVLVIADPATASTGLARLLLPYGSSQWPARTGVQSLMNQIVIAGHVHPRGQALPLRASVTKGPQDQRIDAYYRLKVDGELQTWQHIILTHQGQGVHERLVDTNAEQIELYFSTEDAKTSTEVIDLVPPPSVRRASLTVAPPDYAQGRVAPLQAELGQGLDDRAVTDTPSLVGSHVTLRFELNKPLPVPQHDAERWLKTTFGWDDNSALPQFTADAENPASWTLQWQLAGTRSLSLRLVDEHGLGNAEPIAYRVEAVEDRPPTVTITKPQADEAVVATAVVPVESEARDDVALSSLNLQAHVQTGGRTAEETIKASAAWEDPHTTNDAVASAQAELDLGPLHVAEGDIVLVSGVASDAYSVGGVEHDPVRSPLRRLRVISQTDFATQLRRQLSAVRQNAIRIEALQAELQDDVTESGVPAGSGLDRAQAQIGERIAGQRASVQDIERLLRQNRLDDAQLGQILQQSQDLLDFAGRSANKAVESIEKRQNVNTPTPQNAETSKRRNAETGSAKDGNSQSSGSQSHTEAAQQSGSQSGIQPSPKPGNQKPSGDQSKGDQQQQPSGGSQSGSPSQPQKPQSDAQSKQRNPKSPDDIREPAEQDRDIVEAQQEVRDELADLIKLLDRDEDTWVVKKQLENLLKEQAQLEATTTKMGEQTIGRKPEELTEQQRSALDDIAQQQRDLRDDARKAIDQLRDRSKAMDKVDPQASEGMKTAADTAEQRQLDRDMENAAKQAEQNQMTSAASSQQSAQSTIKQMLNNIEETKRAKAQQLIRQLASLIESIQRLITVQENELNSLALAKDTNDFSGLDRAMIRLNQNTQAVAGEARAAGQEARRVARTLDRAADTQGSAVVAFRSDPVNADEAQTAETRSLELLKEAKALAEELQKKTEEQETRKRREELMEAYRKFAERQISVRTETLPLSGVAQLDRRQLVEARRLGTSQDEIRTGLNQLRDVTAEIMDSPIFVHVHHSIDGWSASITDMLNGGTVNVNVTDRQQQIADSIGRLIKALEESLVPPDEFVKDQANNQGGQQGQGQGQQPLIPPVAQLKLLQGLQEQVYNLTKEIDGRSDLDAAQRRERLRDLGQQQRDLMDLGKQMIESLQGGQPKPPQPETPGTKDEPKPQQPDTPGPG